MISIQRLFDWRNRKPFGHRSVLLVATDSFSGPQSGISDILIDTSRFIVSDPRQNRIRELSLTGLGHVEMLTQIPVLQQLVQCEAQPRPKFRLWGSPLSVDGQLDLASHLKAEGDAERANGASKLIKPPLSDKVNVCSLGEEFMSLQYE